MPNINKKQILTKTDAHPQKKTVKKTKEKVAKKTGTAMTMFDINGKEVKKVELSKEIFAVDVSLNLLAQYVRVYLANQRQGTASSKTRGEVRGSTRKIYRQKGTGRARHGDIKAPIFVGGGVVGGPKPRDFSLKINKKQKRKALFGALSLSFKKKQIYGLTDDALEIKPKTKLVISFLKALNLDQKKILVILPKKEKNNLYLAARNIANLSLTDVTSLNAYQVLAAEVLVIIDGAIEVFKKHFFSHEN